MKKISNLLMMALLTVGMGLTSCDEQLDNAVDPGVMPVVDEKGEVTSITVDLSKIDEKYLDAEKKLVLTEGDVVTLSFTILPEELADTKVELTADDETILSIEGLKVTALKAGETKVTAKAGEKEAYLDVMVKELIDLSTITENYPAQDGIVLTGTLGENVKISIADGATVTLKDVTINGTNNSSYVWAGITCVGDATIILEGTNSVKGFYEDYPGIYVPVDKTLTIQGTGSLDASSNGYGAAGIGGGYMGSCGNIVINGGTVTATGGEMAAGIGGGQWNTSSGTITITSGVTSVIATKGTGAPCSIGKGNGGQDITVTIEDGANVTATGHALSASAVGEIVGSDGKAYVVGDKDILPSGVTAVAMVAYKSATVNESLAIQLNGSPEKMRWADAKTYAEGLTAVTGGTWGLPSQADWQNMFVGCAVSGDASAGNNMNPIAGFKAKIAATGITWQSHNYWSSTASASGVWGVGVDLDGSNVKADFYELNPSYESHVLACLAF